MWLATLFADGAGLDPTTLTPWTAAGLLAGLLSWYLFVRTPAIDKIIKSRDEQFTALTETFAKALAQKDVIHAQALKDKDAQLDSSLTHKWEALRQMSGDYSQSVRDLSKTFSQTTKELGEHCDRTEQRLIAAFEKRLRTVEGSDDKE